MASHSELNPQQQEAVLYTNSPLLLLAGAGSGKTRVITHKFVHLVKNKKMKSEQILTVTFTNKAAEEMRVRISQLLRTDTHGFWIGTFHSQCNKILRKEIKVFDYSPDFCIYDENDQCNLMRQILREFKMYEALYKGVVARISNLKAHLVSPERFVASGDSYGFDEKLARIYARYQAELKKANALDLDDLIMLTVRLFEEKPRILSKYQDLFSYILVDEFQDTNVAQYRLIRLLAERDRNICVVGDDDQSIYKFRGANVGNIYTFERDFPDAKIIKLEQNYRSTQNILDVSGAVISRNEMRKEKRLWTERGCGEKVCCTVLHNEEDEARYIVRMIKDIYLKGNYKYRDFAVLYRLNILSRPIEEALRAEGIPYKVVGGVAFYQRKEIKDMLAYLRLAVNPRDNVSLRRIINVPSRGIGTATITKIENEAKKNSISLFESIKRIISGDVITASLRTNLQEFVNLIEELIKMKDVRAEDVLRFVLEKTSYMDGLEEERIENIEELISSAMDISLREFLDKTSLFTNLDDLPSSDVVSLMTIHTAKGLEFPVVFITGLEEGILPYFKATEVPEDICEERRLFYVAMTRAKDMLFMSTVKLRRLYLKVQEQEISRFLSDVPRECTHWIDKTITKSEKKVNIVKEIKKVDIPYPAGCRVRHPIWGIGVVRDCYGEGDDRKVSVNFQTVGLKRLAIKFANLERL